MEKNKNPEIMVMDARRFAELMCLAEIGASECGRQDVLNRLSRHIRHFNIPIAQGLKEDLKEKRKQYLEKRALIRKLISEHHGKDVFIKESDGCYKPAVLLGRGLLSKETVRVKSFVLGQSGAVTKMDVHVGHIATSKPAGFQFCVGGKWKNTYINF